jgi:hypothetical protein
VLLSQVVGLVDVIKKVALVERGENPTQSIEEKA